MLIISSNLVNRCTAERGNKTRPVVFALCVAFLFLSSFHCSKESAPEPDERILVNIDDQVSISLNEFIRRAEYTPRPDYCRMNTYLHKKIILNSLIAEKLFALEAGQENPVVQDERFQEFIKGRKEQAMRQWMHHVEATQNVELDSSEVKRAYQRAGREYEIAYFSTRDTAIVNAVHQRPTEATFQSAYARLTGHTEPPERTVQWSSGEHHNVHRALFSNDWHVGDVLPPVQVADGDYLVMQVLGWSENMAITDTQQQQRLNEVTEKLTEVKASEIWTQYVADIMRGKRMDFNAPVFERMSDLFFNIYFRSDAERREQLMNKIWSDEEREINETLGNMPDEEFLQQPFFTVDGEVWTVDDFRRELVSHPLVFRKRRMPSDEFAAQFRLAVADLVRDHFVTQEAYNRGYDEVNIVKRNTAMWRDGYVALYHKNQVLKAAGETRNFNQHYHAILDDVLNPYVRELQEKYYKQIELDFEAFEEVALTSIDLFVKQPDMPFKYVVPFFPIVTSEHLIDYVTKMYP